MPQRPRPPEPTREELKARAEERFKFRTEQTADKPKAMREYREAEQATRDLSAKLRSERLARAEEAKKSHATLKPGAPGRN